MGWWSKAALCDLERDGSYDVCYVIRKHNVCYSDRSLVSELIFFKIPLLL